MVPLGLAQAATVRVGRAFGAQDREGVARAGRAAFALSVGFVVCTALLMWLAPHLLISVFLDFSDPRNAPVVTFAISFLVLAAIFQLADATQVVGSGMLRGLQDTRVPMIYAGLGYWGVGLPLGVALAFGTSLRGVGIWIGLAVGLAVVALLMLWRWTQREALGLLVPGRTSESRPATISGWTNKQFSRSKNLARTILQFIWHLALATLMLSANDGAAKSDDRKLLVGWMHSLALMIREGGYDCTEVLLVTELGFELEGRVADVICHSAGFGERHFKVIFFTDGDIIVRRWNGGPLH
jgi:hypothetical protein